MDESCRVITGNNNNNNNNEAVSLAPRRPFCVPDVVVGGGGKGTRVPKVSLVL